MAKKWTDPTRKASLPHSTPEQYRDWAIYHADEFTVHGFGGRGPDGRVIREMERISVSQGDWKPAFETAKERGREMADRIGRGALIYAVYQGSGVHAFTVYPSKQKVTVLPRRLEEEIFKG